MSNDRDVTKGNWDEDLESTNRKSDGSGNKTEYLNMSGGGNFQIRLVGHHIVCRKMFKPYRATLHVDDKNTDPAWKAGFYPSKRYAINVIDRADGKLKVLEKGPKVFDHFKNYKSATGIDPSGKEAPDFSIKVTVPKNANGQPDVLGTQYAVVPLSPTPITAEEMQMIKDRGGLYPLADIYKPTSVEKLQEMWDALPEERKIPPKKPWETDKAPTSPTRKTEPTAELKPDESTGGADDFLNESQDDSTDLF